MNIFISQSMNDRDIDEIKEERMKLLKKLPELYGKDKEYYLIDNLQEDYTPKVEYPRLAYLGNSIAMMSNADKIIFVNHCDEKSNGCATEMFICKLYDIPFDEVDL
jgi:hypothetical protein